MGSEFQVNSQVAASQYDSSVSMGPDGDFVVTWKHVPSPENRIPDYYVPVSSLVGIFLGPDQPNLSPVPDALNFDSGGNVVGGVNYTTLSPLLKQVFFIGDGKTDSGVTQKIVVPDGATRLFLGQADGRAWGDNYGSLTVEVTETLSFDAATAFSATANPNGNRVSGWEARTSLGSSPTPYTVKGNLSTLYSWSSSAGANVNIIRNESNATYVDSSNNITLEPGQLSMPPVITSTPPNPAVVGLPYVYQVAAQDAENDTLTYRLGGTALSGMAIDATSGKLTWTPTAANLGNPTVTVIAAEKPAGQTVETSTSQTFTSRSRRWSKARNALRGIRCCDHRPSRMSRTFSARSRTHIWSSGVWNTPSRTWWT